MGHANYGNLEASPENKGGDCCFIEERRKFGKVVLHKCSLEENEFEVVVASHWLKVRAASCWAKRKSSFFLLNSTSFD